MNPDHPPGNGKVRIQRHYSGWRLFDCMLLGFVAGCLPGEFLMPYDGKGVGHPNTAFGAIIGMMLGAGLFCFRKCRRKHTHSRTQ